MPQFGNCAIKNTSYTSWIQHSNNLTSKPSSLEIEITETIWMGNNDEAIDTLHALRKRGISVAIDDLAQDTLTLRI